MQMKRSKVLLALVIALNLTAAACAADLSDTYYFSFDYRSFTLNKDGIRYEMPENSSYRVIPRLKGTEVWTRFQIPNEVKTLLNWSATAVVKSSDGPSAGVALICESERSSLTIAPDGSGAMKVFDDTKVIWSSRFQVKNFAFPANLALLRDANGSFTAYVDGRLVAASIREYDVKTPKTSPITSAAFVTESLASDPGKAGVLYEKLDVSASGRRVVVNIFGEQVVE